MGDLQRESVTVHSFKVFDDLVQACAWSRKCKEESFCVVLSGLVTGIEAVCFGIKRIRWD